MVVAVEPSGNPVDPTSNDGPISTLGISYSPAGDFSKFRSEIQRHPVLDKDEEFDLIRRWQEKADQKAAQRLIASHLRLIAKIANGFRSYGLPLDDLVSEGCVGMVQAINRFDPERGFRLSTYAKWWIRAAMQEYIMQSYSMVKIGTTAAQKKLFFNLRKLKNQLRIASGQDMSNEDVEAIMTRLDVRRDEVLSMNCRMTNQDVSLNKPVDDDFASEWIDRLVDDTDDQEAVLGERQAFQARRRLLAKALDGLDERERRILVKRRMTEDQPTLGELGREFNLSPERVRQIEKGAFFKIQETVMQLAGGKQFAV